MKFQDLVVTVRASNNRRALSEITNIPLNKVKPEDYIKVTVVGNKIRGFEGSTGPGKGFWASLFS